jgi:2-iminobutanoate/2-iminopropanoate deaminase
MKVNREVKHYPMYYGGVKQVYPNIPPGSPIYAKTVVVGNLVFCSGMTAQDVETGKVLVHDMTGQMLVVLDKVRAALEEAGSSMNNIVKTLMLLKNLKDYQVMRKTELEYYQKHAPLLVEQPPASTFMQPASLARPEFLVEMDVIAVVSR